MEKLSPFEIGVLTSLASITATLRSTPGFDGEALTKAAEFFIDNPAQGCTSGDAKAAYEWPLAILRMPQEQLQNWLNADKTRN